MTRGSIFLLITSLMENADLVRANDGEGRLELAWSDAGLKSFFLIAMGEMEWGLESRERERENIG